MNLYEIFKSISNVIADTYEFVRKLLFYRIELFDLDFTIIESIGVIAAVGLGVYVTVKIISIFV